MDTSADLLDRVPSWLLRALPTNFVRDKKLEAGIDKLAKGLPDKLYAISQKLDRVQHNREYDSAVNRATAHVWRALDRFFVPDAELHSLFYFARKHMFGPGQARVIRRLAKDTDMNTRRAVLYFLEKSPPREVALPASRDGEWDASGWLRGVQFGRLLRQRPSRTRRVRNGLPEIRRVKDLIKLLAIRSEKQLGYLLLATDANGGPYTRFTIPKRGGGERAICAPQAQLRWVQRRILDSILSLVPPHEAAHGFIPGRSTVTNAAPHRGAGIVLKFDLTDFFPTIHYYRVMGLFAGLGYHIDNGCFETRSSSKNIAPVLARLCTYNSNPARFGAGVLPQGAPTSPAISNLICRRLDARLDGLARRSAGTYTRYADDLTFSFREEQPHLGRFRWWVDQICHQEGFVVNQSKFRAIRRSQRQSVTGIVVNDELRIPRPARRRFRAILHNCRVHGVESQSRGNPSFDSYLRGFASYVHMVHPEEGAELLAQVDELLGAEPESDAGEANAP